MEKRGVFTTSFWDNKGRGEHGSLKETIVGMCGSCFGAVECMKKQVVRPVE
jgi:hypothetical protein